MDIGSTSPSLSPPQTSSQFRGRGPFKFLDRPPQPGDHAIAVHVHGPCGQPERLGDFLRFPPLDRGPPEGLPRGIAEVASYPVDGPLEELAAVFLLEERGGVRARR